jgi:hypothetical protein
MKTNIALTILFIALTIWAVYQFYRAANRSKAFFIISTLWLVLQGTLAATGFYTHEFTVPPKFMLMIAPPMLAIVVLFISPKGRSWMDSIDLKALTLLHIIRVPVEIGLYFLFIAKTIPEAMTFEGRNFDIIAGLTAPVIYYMVFVKGKYKRGLLLGWNIAALLLLFNIVSTAVLSLKTPFQVFGFNQPNIALTQFPFNWLACGIVPLVLLAHLIAIRRSKDFGSEE